MTERLPKVAIAGLVATVMLFAAYANHFGNGFHFDDVHTIVDNAAIRDLRNLPSFFTDASTFSNLPKNQSYRPLVTTLNAIDYHLGGGLNPVVFHVSIFVSFLALLALLFVFLRRCFEASRPHPWNGALALAATAFYGLHTANAETINYVISRSDGFSTLCIVAGLVLWQRPTTRRLQLHLLAFLGALYTKQTGLIFAPLLFLYSLLFDSRRDDDRTGLALPREIGSTLWRTAPVLVLGPLVFLVNQLLLTPSSTVSSNTGTHPIDYFLTQLWIVIHYLGNFVAPLRLSADPDFRVITDPTDPRILAGACVVTLLVAAATLAALRRRTAPIGYGIFWFFLALLPTSSFVPLFQIANDHRTFFPYIGLAFASVWAVGLALEPRLRGHPIRQRLVVAAFAALLAAHAVGVHARNEVWGSSEALWLDVTQKSPRNGRGHMNYGLTQMAKANYDGARESFERALEIVPHYSYLHINFGILEEATGNSDKAEEHFRRALTYDPQNPESYHFFAKWLHEQGRTDEAVTVIERGLTVSPGHQPMRDQLAALQSQAPSGDETLAAMRRRAEASPSAQAWLALGFAYYEADRLDDAIDGFRKALALDSRSAVAFNNLCSALNRLARWDEAEEACVAALEIDPGFERARANLQWARDGRAGN